MAIKHVKKGADRVCIPDNDLAGYPVNTFAAHQKSGYPVQRK